MNKKFFFLGGAALMGAAFVALTAFGGVTKAQQMAQIDEQVSAQLVTLRETKTKECDESVAKAASAKAQEMLAAPAAQEPALAAKPGAAKPTKKPTKGGTTTPKVDPMPQPAPPAKPADKGKMERGDAANKTVPGEVMKRGDAVKPAEAGSKMKRGDAVKKEGGN